MLLAVAMLLSGCDAVRSLVSGENSTEVPAESAEFEPAAPPDPAVVHLPAVVEATHSVVRVRSTAHSCQKIFEGSGVVMAPNRVMSNAHVVAGGDSFTIAVGDSEYDAGVVFFDPKLDIAVLDVPGLAVAPLHFAEAQVPKGTDAVVMGYPGGGEFLAAPARIRDVIQLQGPDIYHSTTVEREVYVIDGEVGQGDSGGPLVDRDGRVLGINFGAAADDPGTGFVLTAKHVYPSLVIGAGEREPVPTGACAG